jgi:hypothetical protein
LDLLQVATRGVGHERFTDGNDTPLGAGDGALEHQEVVLDNTVVGESTHRRDEFLCDVRLGRGIGVVGAGANAVDLLVELGTVVVSVYRKVNTSNV